MSLNLILGKDTEVSIKIIKDTIASPTNPAGVATGSVICEPPMLKSVSLKNTFFSGIATSNK